MGITVTARTPDGQLHIIQAPTYGTAHDRADDLGAVRIQDGLGDVALKIGGEWVYLPRSTPAGRGHS